MEPQALITLIRGQAGLIGLDPDLAVAIAGTETGFDPDLTRYEPLWRYFLTPEVFAEDLKTTHNTEETHQATSWGVMQVMGTIAREFGYKDHLWRLAAFPQLGVKYGCLKLKQCRSKYPVLDDAIASYNAGEVKMLPNGKYQNQTYVDRVQDRLAKLKGIALNSDSGPA